MKHTLVFSMLIATSFVAGCATLGRELTPTQLGNAAIIAQPAKSFTSAGRFSAKRGEAQGSGQFRYTQNGDQRTLEIFTPASTPLARIEADAQSATLKMSDGAVRSGATLSELLQSFIDVPISDAQFSAWLQALPTNASDATAIERDDKARLQRFTEKAWIIDVSARMDGDAGFVRRMRWTFAPETTTEVRWVIDEFATQ
jgi:outer membrane biogenesis lipoprotein LolB